MFSFSSNKTHNNGDGGMLCMKNKKLIDKAKELDGWYQQEDKQRVWENDIFEVGYKYQMTDLGASLGFTALKEFNKLLKHRQKYFKFIKTFFQKI